MPGAQVSLTGGIGGRRSASTSKEMRARRTSDNTPARTSTQPVVKATMSPVWMFPGSDHEDVNSLDYLENLPTLALTVYANLRPAIF